MPKAAIYSLAILEPVNVRNREAFGSAFQTNFMVEDDCHFTRGTGTYYARWNFKKTNIAEGQVFSQGSCVLKGMQQWTLLFPWHTFSVHCRGNSANHNSPPHLHSCSWEHPHVTLHTSNTKQSTKAQKSKATFCLCRSRNGKVWALSASASNNSWAVSGRISLKWVEI